MWSTPVYHHNIVMVQRDGTFGYTASQLGNLNLIENNFPHLNSIIITTHNPNIDSKKKKIYESITPINRKPNVNGILNQHYDIFSLSNRITLQMKKKSTHLWNIIQNLPIFVLQDFFCRAKLLSVEVGELTGN